jgi:hypothetical protein
MNATRVLQFGAPYNEMTGKTQAQELLVAKSATMQTEAVSSAALRVGDTSLAGVQTSRDEEIVLRGLSRIIEIRG